MQLTNYHLPTNLGLFFVIIKSDPGFSSICLFVNLLCFLNQFCPHGKENKDEVLAFEID